MESRNFYYHRFDVIPAFNFNQFMIVGDPELLMKTKVEKPKFEDVQNVWDDLFQQYIDFMGIGDRQDTIIRLENRICKLVAQIYVEDKRHLMAVLKQERKNLSLLKEKIENKGDSYSETAAMSKYLGFHINTKEISAKEYFSYIKLIKSDG